MKRLNEEDVVYSEAHAKELLAVQTDYNNKLKGLNDELAKKKSDLLVKYMNMAKQKKETQAQKQAQAIRKSQTGTVDAAGNPVTASGNPAPPTVESYPDILKMKKIYEDDEEIRFSERPSNYSPDFRNWYQKPEAQADYEEPKPKRVKKKTAEVQRKMWDLEDDIENLKQEIESIKEPLQTPTFSGVQGEIENFFGEVGFEAADILNSGLPDEQKLESLDAIGIKNPKEILDTYYYYYPEFNPALDKKRKEAEKKIESKEREIQKLQDELNNMKEIYESKSVNESIYNIEKFPDIEEYEDLKDYLDAESISYIENEDENTIEFDESEVDDEWKDRLETLTFKDFDEDEEDPSDILSIEDEEEFVDKSEKVDEQNVFYVKVEDEGKAFVGKIYKLFDEGDWRSKIIDGDSKTFEKLNYDPDWDEIDIIAFLRENYADADIISEKEFDEHVEEPEIEIEEENYEEIEESQQHSIPTLDEYMIKKKEN